jgi:hypothetical protein
LEVDFYRRTAFDVDPSSKSKQLPLSASNVVLIKVIVCAELSGDVEADPAAMMFAQM